MACPRAQRPLYVRPPPLPRARLVWASARRQMLPSSIGQDATLSRWRERFDSARERHRVSYHSDFLSIFAFLPKLLGVVWATLFVRCSLSLTTARLAPRRLSASRVYFSACARVV